MAIRNDNYVNIQGWMYKLQLEKLNELIAFAIIHGFSQDTNSQYKGGYSYMSDLLLCDRRTVMRVLASLEDKGLIVKSQKEINGVKFNRYKVSDYSLQFCHEWCQNVTGGSENLSYKNKNKDNNKESTHYVRTEEKSEKCFDLTFIRADFVPVVTEWLTHKKKVKKAYKTEGGIKKMYNNLYSWSCGNPDIAQKIVDQSIANNWDGLFPLKDRGQTSTTDDELMAKSHRILVELAKDLSKNGS